MVFLSLSSVLYSIHRFKELTRYWLSECVNEWVNEWVSGWAYEWVSDWVSVWASEMQLLLFYDLCVHKVAQMDQVTSKGHEAK